VSAAALPPRDRCVVTRRELGQGALAAWVTVGAALARVAAGAPASSFAGGATWRGDFPVLEQTVNGHALTYLDSAATTQRPAPVLEALLDYYLHDNANPGSALHTLARRAHERYEGARSALAAFINAPDPEEIVWVRGTTEGINLVASAWGRPRLRSGDEILLTVAEHASNLLPWRLVAEETRATLRYVDVDDEGRIRLDDLERQLSAHTKIVAFSHVSNVAGFINPAAEICACARSVGARVLIDAAQSAPHVPLDVRALGCDFLAFSSHKMLGPMGVGVLWARRELLDEMSPYQAGSNMAHAIDFSSQELEHAARKFGAGTPNVAGAIGLAAAVKYLGSQERGAIEQHEAQLTRYALKQLADVPGLRLLGPRSAERRIPVLSFVLQGRSPAAVLSHLDSRGIAVRAGDLAALPLLRRFGVDAAVRASCYLYTGTADLDRLAAALHELTHTSMEDS
jgi:cysteine desulfurase/selenocysteine lyase